MNKYLQLMNFQNSGKPQNDKNSEFPGESTTTGFYCTSFIVLNLFASCSCLCFGDFVSVDFFLNVSDLFCWSFSMIILVFVCIFVEMFSSKLF